MKRKIFTLLLSACLGTMAMAQAPNVVIKKAKVNPEIDGVVDDVWANASKQSIDKPFQAETPTLGEAGTTTWQALWNDEGIFLLLTVNDDEFYPGYMNNDAATDWKYDKPEIYFDVNAVKKDGIGGGGGKGHFQFAPGFLDTELDGTLNDDGADGMHAFKVTGSTYKAEYFFPFTKFVDMDGTEVDITKPIGFDVTIIDGESAAPGIRQRAVWTNVGAINESYNNMDDCGTITLSSADAVINKAETAPEVDGTIDEVWASANTYNIEKSGANGAATLGEPGSTTWKALWTDDGIFILLTVNDDVWNPSYKTDTPDASWNFDKPEIYFDVNAEKNDSKGPVTANSGHYQVAPAAKEATIDGTPGTDNGATFAFKVTEPTYVAEYFVPFTKLMDKDGVEINKAIPMGFDVTIIDQDADGGERRFGVWVKEGEWDNMDGAGMVVFDGAVMAADVEDITVSGGNSITTDNGTLQMVAAVEPSDANQNVKWVVENGTGRATIDAKGVLTGVLNGTVLVKAIAKDGTDVEGKTTVTISGQIVTMGDINMLKNSYFELGTDGKQDWGGAGIVADSWYNLDCVTKVNIWDTMFGQPNLKIADGETPYTVKFKAFASADMVVPMLFEDRNNGNNKALTSISEYRGAERWEFPVTTEAKWFTVDVVFSAMAENSAWEINYQVGMVDGTFSIDSIMMFADADLALVSSVKTLSNVNKVQLYPNPVQTELTISKIAVANSKVSVYNAVGQKLMEKTANGNQAKFDVANLRKGMYFVRFSDGSSEKFLKQ